MQLDTSFVLTYLENNHILVLFAIAIIFLYYQYCYFNHYYFLSFLFCFFQEQKGQYFDWAAEEAESEIVKRFTNLARELEIVLPISFFEKSNNAFYNSVVVIDSDGRNLGKYRKTHIPDGPGYQEKFYFTPGDTGFTVFSTSIGKIGVGICWDQWFPETARALALQGAEVILYPTAIGSEPENPEYDSSAHWERCMVGHSACNMVPVIASNRIGTETFEKSSITFYGNSLITDCTGKLLAHASRDKEEVILATLDLDECASMRREWGLYRDRRPNTYGVIMTKDGKV